ncbi:MAG: L,D-transpeptidase [Pseudomonadota bacterium]|nr:L,D-transpeptidase [Pseudomonadota bacterium]
MPEFPSRPLTRRTFLSMSISASAFVAGCATTEAPVTPALAPAPARPSRPTGLASDAELEARYAAVEDGGHLIPAVPFREIDPKNYRQRVVDPTGEKPGTVVVDTSNRFLYLTEPGGTAMRYGVGIGRDGFAWHGEGIVHWRQPWPRWKPPAAMIARQPSLEKYSVENGGMAPGIANPLGARALYIFQNGADTLYRLHGTAEWRSIGKAASAGCVRLINQDVIDLYRRVPHHARIVVLQTPLATVA